MRFLLAVLLAAPVMAQSSTETPVAVPPVETEVVDPAPQPVTVDPALIGEWTLDEMTSPGVLASFGVDVQSMTAVFSADGQAKISMTAVQDGETMFRDRTFTFRTEDGDILEEGDEPVSYQIWDDGALQLTDGEMVIRFVRAAP